jgi:hypothetical protein
MGFINFVPEHECEFPEIKKSYPDGIVWECDECKKQYTLKLNPYWGRHEWELIETE